MNQLPRTHVDLQRVEAVVKRLFPARDTQVERVLSGISTYVYRIYSQDQIYYMRILPDAEASFTPEIAVLTHLRQQQITVPEIIHYEDHNKLLGRSIMVETEITGLALSQSSLPREILEKVTVEAGRDLARLNGLTVEGFGWVSVRRAQPTRLRAQWPTFRAFALAFRAVDLTYLRTHVLKPEECRRLEHVFARYDSWLDSIQQGYLAHGDFDSTHIFQHHGHYTGIIDFGEVRGTNRWYDLAHFRIRDSARPPFTLFQALERGYAEIMPLPPDYELNLRLTSLIINLRALVRAFQSRPPDQYMWRQLEMLHEDVAILA
ncbi:MAG TPA: aminoglycoside phosphotransferase family protein [Ktedonobacteraceae bacterium]